MGPIPYSQRFTFLYTVYGYNTQRPGHRDLRAGVMEMQFVVDLGPDPASVCGGDRGHVPASLPAAFCPTRRDPAPAAERSSVSLLEVT